MLIRFVVDNVYSFGKQREFSMFPNSRLKTLQEHKYTKCGIDLLKMTSIYGANGAGKSNLIKSIALLRHIVLRDDHWTKSKNFQFKLSEKSETKKQVLAVEFIQDDIPLYYGIEIQNGNIITEELYQSGLGITDDLLVFERKTDEEGATKLKFSDAFESDEKSTILKQVLIEDFIKPNEASLKLLSKRENENLSLTKIAFKWFSDTLEIITPDSKPAAMAHRVDIDESFKQYAQDIMCTFHVGINSLKSEKKEIHEFFGKENEAEAERLINQIEDTSVKMVGLRSRKGDELVLVKEGDSYFVKRLILEHKGENDFLTDFYLDEESDGTIRLLDFVPAFQDLLSKNKVFIIDELERSIHPLLIKELVMKFSLDNLSKGQLIFTTHESNLLDQDIFRQDEIWFAEKDENGSTDLSSLSDFKEHKTIDIRKGYLNGRYGSIPFLGNLKDLNWHKYDIN